MRKPSRSVARSANVRLPLIVTAAIGVTVAAIAAEGIYRARAAANDQAERSFSAREDTTLLAQQAQRRSSVKGDAASVGDRVPAGTYDNPIPLSVRHGIRVVYQIKTDEWKKEVAAGLHYLDKLATTYDELGIDRQHRHIVGVFHGDAGYFLVSDPAYENAAGKPGANPNKQIVKKLLAAGVSLELCKSTMQSHGWTGDDVLPGVKVVVGAYPRIIDLQLRGYAYIRF